MTVTGDTIVWASALIVAVAIVAGAVWKFAKRDATVDVSAAQTAEKLRAVDTAGSRLNALELRIALLEQNHVNHTTSDSAAFIEVRGALEKMSVSIDELKQDVTEVLVAARLKDRTGARADPTKT